MIPSRYGLGWPGQANGLEIVNLDGNGLAALLIQHLEAVHQRHGDDGTFAPGGAAEAAAVELSHLVAVPAAGSLREDQIIPPRLYLPDDALNHRQGLAHVLPVHGKGLGADGHLMEKGNVVQLLFQHRAHGDVTGCRHGEDIEHTLMVGVKHEPALFGDILRSRYLQIDVAAPYRPFQDVLDMPVHFLLGILFGVLCVTAELLPRAGDNREIFQYHGDDAIHFA